MDALRDAAGGSIPAMAALLLHEEGGIGDMLQWIFNTYDHEHYLVCRASADATRAMGMDTDQLNLLHCTM